MNGVKTGLPYGQFPLIWDLYGVKKKHHKESFDCLRIMEHEALLYFQEEREKEARKRK